MLTRISNLRGISADSSVSSNDIRKIIFPTSSITNNGGGTVTLTFAGSGSGLTNLNASNISSGTLADGRLSSNVPFLNAANTFTNTQTITPTGSNFGLVINIPPGNVSGLNSTASRMSFPAAVNNSGVTRPAFNFVSTESVDDGGNIDYVFQMGHNFGPTGRIDTSQAASGFSFEHYWNGQPETHLFHQLPGVGSPIRTMSVVTPNATKEPLWYHIGSQHDFYTNAANIAGQPKFATLTSTGTGNASTFFIMNYDVASATNWGVTISMGPTASGLNTSVITANGTSGVLGDLLINANRQLQLQQNLINIDRTALSNAGQTTFGCDLKVANNSTGWRSNVIMKTGWNVLLDSDGYIGWGTQGGSNWPSVARLIAFNGTNNLTLENRATSGICLWGNQSTSNTTGSVQIQNKGVVVLTIDTSNTINCSLTGMKFDLDSIGGYGRIFNVSAIQNNNANIIMYSGGSPLLTTYLAGGVQIENPLGGSNPTLNIAPRGTQANILLKVTGDSATSNIVTFAANNTATSNVLKLQGATSQSGNLLELWGISSSSTQRRQGYITSIWKTSTDATRQGQINIGTIAIVSSVETMWTGYSQYTYTFGGGVNRLFGETDIMAESYGLSQADANRPFARWQQYRASPPGIRLSCYNRDTVAFNYQVLTINQNGFGIGTGVAGDTGSGQVAIGFTTTQTFVDCVGTRKLVFGPDYSGNSNMMIMSLGTVNGAADSFNFIFKRYTDSVLANQPSLTMRAKSFTFNIGGDDSITLINNFNMGYSGSSPTMGFFGKTAILQPTASLVTTGYTAGSSTTMTIDGKSTGGVGSTAYTFGDLVSILKNLGLLAS